MRAAREFSAGGVVVLRGRVLLVRMRRRGQPPVWTYPKGHVERGETPRAAALREVFEESGCECDILGPLLEVRYSFRRKGRLVRKRVRWYRMRPVRRPGRADPDEILGTRWARFAAAERLLEHPSDFRLLRAVRRRA